MYDPPGYLWAITIAGITAIPAATCVVLYGGAQRAGLGRKRAALLAGSAAAVLGGWFAASAVIAGHGWYHAQLGHGVPWLPVAVAGFFAAPLVARRLAQGGGRRAARWFTAFGMTDLVVVLTLGTLTGFQLVNVPPSGSAISELPLALIPSAAVPLLFPLHITSVSALRRAHRAPRPAGPLTAAI